MCLVAHAQSRSIPIKRWRCTSRRNAYAVDARMCTIPIWELYLCFSNWADQSFLTTLQDSYEKIEITVRIWAELNLMWRNTLSISSNVHLKTRLGTGTVQRARPLLIAFKCRSVLYTNNRLFEKSHTIAGHFLSTWNECVKGSRGMMNTVSAPEKRWSRTVNICIIWQVKSYWNDL